MTDPRRPTVLSETPAARRLLLAAALAVLALVVAAPLAAVLAGALRDGPGAWLRAVTRPEARAALRLTLLATGIALAVNAGFGVAAAWLLAKHRFPGRSLLVSLVDLPLSVSPVIAGLLFVLLCGRRGLLGPWLDARGVAVVFAVPGIVLATTFVTFPFVAREVLAVLEMRGDVEEEAALSLGAGGWATFRRVTLPNAKWGLLYGSVLCAARAMGEFGAVSVVSGHVRGHTNTLPLHAEILYDEYDSTGAFAVASLLTLLAVTALVARRAVLRRSR